VLRRRLRADSVAGVSDTTAEHRVLSDLAARSTANADEQRRLATQRDGDVVAEHPHAHLRHRPVPLPTEPSQRRRLLRIWATISTPLLFTLLALMVRSEDRSVLGSAVGAFVIVLGIEALTRRRLATYVIRLGVLVALFFLGGLVVAGLIASWRLTVVVLLLTLAGVFLFLNLRELRRT
jgi:hypothetical protein